MAVLALLTLLQWGCEQSPAEPSAAVISRLLEQDPAEPLTPSAIGTEEVLVGFETRGGALPAGWQELTRAGSPPRRSPQGAEALLWLADVAAAEITAIEVVVDRLAGGVVRLEWTSADEPMMGPRSMALQRNAARDRAGRVIRFDTHAHGRWRGRLARVRVGIEGPAAPGAGLVAVRVLTTRVDAERMAAAAARGWKAMVDDEWRSALMAVPGSPHRWRVDVPPAGHVRFSWAKATRGPLALQIRLQMDGESRVLFQRQLPSDILDTWEEAELSLVEYAGREVELGFDALGDTAGPVWALWGNPVLVGAGSRHPPRPPVILISIDTLRADRLSLYGYARNTSANIDRWASRRGVVFERAVAPAPWTLPSHASLFTGLEAIRHGANFGGRATRLGRELITMAEVFRRSGYLTAAITGGGFVHPRYGFDHGFESYRFWPGDQPSEDELEDGLDRLSRYVAAAGDAPFFLFFHTFEVHSPSVRQPHFRRFSVQDPESKVIGRRGAPRKETGFVGRATVLVDDGSGPKPPQGGLESLPGDLYDSAIAFTDEQLGELFAALEASGLMDRGIVALTSDHGEALGEEDRWSHGYLWESNLEVPLVLSLPRGRLAGSRISRQVRLIDLMPTVLEAAGLAAPAGIDGFSLLPLLEGRSGSVPRAAISYAASTNRGLAVTVDGWQKYVFQDSVWPPVRGGELLFDLRSDPGELDDRSAHEVLFARMFRGAARRILVDGYSGLHIRLANATAHAVRGIIESPWISPTGTKSAELPCDCLRWEGRGRASFEIPKRAAYTIVGLYGEPSHLELSGSFEIAGCPRPVPFRAVATATELDEPRSLELNVATCSMASVGGSPIATGLTFWWVGPRDVRPPASGVDPLLEERLQALGYVE